MPATLSAVPVRTEHPYPPRKQWTREECDFLLASGLPDLDRYELVEGELIGKMGKNQPHQRALVLLYEYLRRVFGPLFVVPEPTVDVAPADNPTSSPEPDAVVLTRPVTELARRARPHEIRLIVEISDTTLAYDLSTKAALYARAGIADYWVLDLNGHRILVHRSPENGVYQSVMAFAEDELLAPLASPAAEVRVASLF